MTNDWSLHNITEGKPYYNTHEIFNLKDMIQKCVERYGDGIAFKYRKTASAPTAQKTYRQFAGDIKAFGSALMDLGLGDRRIAIIGENSYEWVISYLAVVNGVGLVVPLDKALPTHELEPLLERGEIDVLIYSQSFHKAVKDIASRNPRLKALICMNPSGEEDFCGPQFYSLPTLLDRGASLLKEGYTKYTEIAIDSAAFRILLFTSGTSSDSKAVMLSHGNICADIMGLGGVVRFDPGEAVLSILPMHHTFENTAGMLFPLYLGMTIAISDGLKHLSKNLTEYQPTCVIGVPLLFDRFKERAETEIRKKGLTKVVRVIRTAASLLDPAGVHLRRRLFKKILSSFGGKLKVIVTGGAAMERQTIKWYESIGIKVYQGYGLTETSPVIAGGNDRKRKTGTCGQPLPGVRIAIANPDDTGYGEIVVQGDIVMQGYWKNDEATEEAIQEGWFHTGDLGRIDKKGLIQVSGRAKAMIVLKNGKKVFPEELESFLNKLKYVRESLVWGEPATDGTVELCSKIILDKDTLSGMDTSPDDEKGIKKLLDGAIREINKLMPMNKKIRYYVYGYEELIKTTTLKVKRYVEAEEIRTILGRLALDMKNAAGNNIDNLKKAAEKNIEDLKNAAGKNIEDLKGLYRQTNRKPIH